MHYIVIGGWLPNYLKDKPKLRNWVSKFNFVYVETHVMLNALVKQGLKNAKHLPNFKRLKVLDESELIYQYNEPYKLCTFSRVMKEKGIEDAINAVTSINNEKKRVVFTLDIYGQIDDNYKERFDELKSAFPDYIKYKGVVDFDKSVDVLKEYMALLFPHIMKVKEQVLF